MRRLVFPTLKVLPFVVGVGMIGYSAITSDSNWYERGHLWIITGMVILLYLGQRRQLADWPLGEIWGAGYESGKKHKRRTASTLRSVPQRDDELPAPRRDRGRFRA